MVEDLRLFPCARAFGGVKRFGLVLLVLPLGYVVVDGVSYLLGAIGAIGRGCYALAVLR